MTFECFLLGILVVIFGGLALFGLIAGWGWLLIGLFTGEWDADVDAAFMCGMVVGALLLLLGAFALIACDLIVQPYLMK